MDNHLKLPLTSFNRAVNVVLGLTLALLAPESLLLADTLSDLEARGQQIYRKGTVSEGEIEAYIGSANSKVPARLFPCANCHGLEGIGKSEGGIEPPNITWKELTKPYGHKHPDGRSHPPFDDGALASAVTRGVDPAENPLDPAMPRYHMSEEDMKALVAYLKILGSDPNPGVTDSSIRVGVMLPAEKSDPSALKLMIRSYFQELNQNGGIFGRKIEPVLVSGSTDIGNHIQELVNQGEVFALLELSFGHNEGEVFSFLEEARVPYVAPLIWLPPTVTAVDRFGFSLLPGLAKQGQALIEFTDTKLKRVPRQALVVFPKGEIYDQALKDIQREALSRGWRQPLTIRYSGSTAEAQQLVERGSKTGVDALYYFGPSRGLPSLMAEAEKQQWSPDFFSPVMVSAREVFAFPKSFSGQVFLVNPTVPLDYTQTGWKEFEQFRLKYQLPKQQRATLIALYATVKTWVEALRRSEHALSREKFFKALQSLNDFETGLTPKISFGINRRTGSSGVYILSVDLTQKKFKGRPIWINLY